MSIRKGGSVDDRQPDNLADDVGRLLESTAADLAKDVEPSDAAWHYAEAAWQSAVVQQQHRQRRAWLIKGFGGFAVAASLTLAVLGGLNYFLSTDNAPIHPRIAGVILNATHGFQVTTTASGRRTIARLDDTVDRTLQDGALLVADADSYLLLELANSALVHVQPGSELTIQPDASIWLHSGRIYVNADAEKATVTTLTKHSKITDIGTEYEVSVNDGSTEVRTREGAVSITTPSGELRSVATAAHAERVLLDDGGSVVEISKLDVDDSSWSWRHKAVPPFIVEGKTVADLAEWIARVEGRELRFATNATEFSSRNERLSGGDITANEAGTNGVDLLNTISGFNLTPDDNRLLLQRKPFQ